MGEMQEVEKLSVDRVDKGRMQAALLTRNSQKNRGKKFYFTLLTSNIIIYHLSLYQPCQLYQLVN
jgi:hypothetical protein